MAYAPSLRNVLDATLEAFVVMDADGRVLDWNHAAQSIFGWTQDEIVGMDLVEVLVPEDVREEHRAGLARFRAGGGGHLVGKRIELRTLHRDGHELPVELALSTSEGERGRVLVALLHDISHRRASEADLRRFETIVASSGDAILSGRLDGTIESWNPAAERLYGYTAEEMIGASVQVLRPTGDLEDVTHIQQALAEGRAASLETQEQRKDGTLVDVSVTMSPLRDDSGAITGLTSVIRDVTERNRARASLSEARDRFAGAFAAASTGMAIVGLDGGLVEVNQALCDLLRRDAAALGGMSVMELTHPDDLEADRKEIEQLLRGDKSTYQRSKRYLLPDGGIVWGLLTVTVVRDSTGRPLHLVSQVEDITDRKTAEGELRRYAAQLEALSELDPVTGLSSRLAFEGALQEELVILAAGGPPCSAVIARVHGGATGIGAAAEALQGISRSEDLLAHLGDRELALLLPRTDEADAAAIARRAFAALGASASGAHTSARPGDTPEAFLDRIRTDLEADHAGAAAATPAPPGIDRLLDLVRRQLGMQVSFLTRLQGDGYVFAALAGDHESLGVREGDFLPLSGTHCVRMLDGRIGPVVADLAADDETRELHVTKGLGLRAYAGVPVRLRSGELYGTLCAVDSDPHRELGERQVELLTFVSELAAELIEDAEARDQAERAEAGARGVKTLLGALAARDYYTGEHSREVVALASGVAGRLGLSDQARRDVEQVALLHDIGKVGIPDAILQKQGPLDEQEWHLMRQHPIVGERIIAGTPGLEHLAPAMRAEHERWDGAGYPDGLAGEAIPLASRVTLACDAFHAMTSDRPYRPAMPLARAEAELRACAGTQFDPRVVNVLLTELGSPAGESAAFTA